MNKRKIIASIGALILLVGAFAPEIRAALGGIGQPVVGSTFTFLYDNATGNLQNGFAWRDSGTIGGGGTLAITLAASATAVGYPTPPHFTSTSTYTVFITDITDGSKAYVSTYTSGTQFTITGTAGHAVQWVAIGY